MYNPHIHHRRSIRLKGYDYSSAGAYFITVVTHSRLCLFGEVIDGDMRLNEAGKIVAGAWKDIPDHNQNIGLDAWVIMPNHVHGIVMVADDGSVGAGSQPALPERAGLEPAPTRHGLTEVIRGFKTFSARRINEIRKTSGTSVWQRNYYEHIIRSESDLVRLREYIDHNPLQWEVDRENPLTLR